MSAIVSEEILRTPSRRHDAKTNAIIHAAREAFLENGLDAANMDDIALRAQVSKRTVYNRFGSKEALFEATIIETCEKLFQLDIEHIEASLSPKAALRALSRGFLKGVLSPEAVALRRVAAFEARRIPRLGEAFLQHSLRRASALFVPALQRIAARGGHEIKDPERAVWQLGALLMEPLLTRVSLGVYPPDMETAIDEQVKLGVDAFIAIYPIMES